MNVLFVSETRFSNAPYRDSSTRLRCYTMAEALHAAGHLADVTTLDTLQLANLSRYDVVCVQQPTASRKLLSVLERCQKLAIRTVADVDKLEFDPRLAEQSHKRQVSGVSVSAIRSAFMRQNLALKHFDEVCAATDELALARREQAPNQCVYVAPNALSNYWLMCHDHLSIEPLKIKRAGFFSDSRGLSADFSVAAPALAQYLAASSNHELFIVGPLSIDDDQFPVSQVVRGAWVDHMDLPASLTHCYVNLAPHQNNRINYAQPHTKFIEAAAFGVPTISSPTAELENHQVPGLFIAENQEQWLEHLNALSDKQFYQHCQQSLFNYAREHCTANNSVQTLIGQWSATHESNNNETTTRLSAASQ